MIVKNSKAAILSNYEVHTIVNEMKHLGSNADQEATQLATIIYETSLYLQELPCKDQSPEKMDSLLMLLKDSKLTKLEKLMICNDPPETALQLRLIVKDCEEKLSENEIQSWLREFHEIMS